MLIPKVTSPEDSLQALRTISASRSSLDFCCVNPVLNLMKSAFSKYNIGPCWNQDSLHCIVQLWKKFLNHQELPMHLTVDVKRELEQFVKKKGFPFVRTGFRSIFFSESFEFIAQKHINSQTAIHLMINKILESNEKGYCLGLALRRGVNFIRGAKEGNYVELIEMYISRKGNVDGRWTQALKSELYEIREFQNEDFNYLDSMHDIKYRWMILNSSPSEMKDLLKEIQSMYGSAIYIVLRSGCHAIGVYFLDGILYIFNQNFVGLEEVIYREEDWIEYIYRALYLNDIHRQARFICAVDFLYPPHLQKEMDCFFYDKEIVPGNPKRLYEKSEADNSAYTLLIQSDRFQENLTQEMWMNQSDALMLSNGWTILMLALRYHEHASISLVEYFLQQVESIQIQNENGWDAFMLACRYQRIEVVDCMLSKINHVNRQNKLGVTALMYYVCSDHFEVHGMILEKFIEKGLNPNLRDIKGRSLLTFLVHRDSEDEALLWMTKIYAVFQKEIKLEILKEAHQRAKNNQKEKITEYLEAVLKEKRYSLICKSHHLKY